MWEDMYICDKAAEVYDELPPHVRPASFVEEANFSSETMYSEEPFGVHQYWPHLDPTSPKLHTMFQHCPEMWGILPPELAAQPKWRNLVCTMQMVPSNLVPGINITFNVRTLCKPDENRP
jgi:hypothetical protein